MAHNSVAAIIFNEDRSQILVIKRRDVPIWTLPGGGVELNETPEAATLREVFEETGLKCSIHRPVALYTPVNRLTNQTYLFECQTMAGKLTTGDETEELGFFPVHQLPKPFFFLHRDWIADAENKSETLIRKPLTQVTYLKLAIYLCKHPIQVIRFMLSRLGLPINSR